MRIASHFDAALSRERGGDADDPLLIVEADGLAPTAGWTHVRLEPHVYITPPDDGVQDFDLVGDRPAGSAADALAPVEAGWEGPLADWLIGVRIHAADNMVEELPPLTPPCAGPPPILPEGGPATFSHVPLAKRDIMHHGGAMRGNALLLLRLTRPWA